MSAVSLMRLRVFDIRTEAEDAEGGDTGDENRDLEFGHKGLGGEGCDGEGSLPPLAPPKQYCDLDIADVDSVSPSSAGRAGDSYPRSSSRSRGGRPGCPRAGIGHRRSPDGKRAIARVAPSAVSEPPSPASTSAASCAPSLLTPNSECSEQGPEFLPVTDEAQVVEAKKEPAIDNFVGKKFCLCEGDASSPSPASECNSSGRCSVAGCARKHRIANRQCRCGHSEQGAAHRQLGWKEDLFW